MKTSELISIKQREIAVKQKEIEILTSINKINQSIFDLQESVINYEEWGVDVNDLQPFIKNYPFKLSLFDYGPNKNLWGNENNEKQE